MSIKFRQCDTRKTLDAVKCGKQHWAIAKLAVTFVSIILAHASAAGVCSGPKCGFAAALLTKMSSLKVVGWRRSEFAMKRYHREATLVPPKFGQCEIQELLSISRVADMTRCTFHYKALSSEVINGRLNSVGLA